MVACVRVMIHVVRARVAREAGAPRRRPYWRHEARSVGLRAGDVALVASVACNVRDLWRPSIAHETELEYGRAELEGGFGGRVDDGATRLEDAWIGPDDKGRHRDERVIGEDGRRRQLHGERLRDPNRIRRARCDRDAYGVESAHDAAHYGAFDVEQLGVLCDSVAQKRWRQRRRRRRRQHAQRRLNNEVPPSGE